MAGKLKDAGVINSEWAFILKSRLNKANLMPGVYVVKASMSADDMIELMGNAENSVVKQPTAEELESESGESQENGESASDTGEGEGGQ